MKKLNRKFYHYTLWEDFINGMYSSKSVSDRNSDAATKLLSDTIQLESAMLAVIDKWPISSSVNLSYRGYNRQAWLGQAACCIWLGLTETETREGWAYLSDEQKDKANKVADHVIKVWENRL